MRSWKIHGTLWINIMGYVCTWRTQQEVVHVQLWNLYTKSPPTCTKRLGETTESDTGWGQSLDIRLWCGTNLLSNHCVLDTLSHLSHATSHTSRHLTPPHITSCHLMSPHATSCHLMPPLVHLMPPHTYPCFLCPPWSGCLPLSPRYSWSGRYMSACMPPSCWRLPAA